MVESSGEGVVVGGLCWLSERHNKSTRPHRTQCRPVDNGVGEPLVGPSSHPSPAQWALESAGPVQGVSIVCRPSGSPFIGRSEVRSRRLWMEWPLSFKKSIHRVTQNGRSSQQFTLPASWGALPLVQLLIEALCMVLFAAQQPPTW